MESALREFEEELGLSAQPEQLELFGTTLVKFGTTFAGKIFRDNEFSNDFVYRQPVDIGKHETARVGSRRSLLEWIMRSAGKRLQMWKYRTAVNPEEFEKLGSYLGIC